MNDVLKPFLPISAAEMKKLVRQDRNKANKMANEGGSNAFAEMKNLATYHLKLLHQRSMLFQNEKNTSREIDGEQPILQLDVPGGR